jgi:hypothetical protein
MLLFNAFSNTNLSAAAPGVELLTGPASSGATLRQTLLGIEFHGLNLPGNGNVHGDLSMDFYSGSSYPSGGWLRIRRGVVVFDWKNRAITVGQDKPLISPLAPSSLAEVGVPALAQAGNLWSWLPQVRYEERLHLGQNWGLTPQIALLQTYETYAQLPTEYSGSLAKSRPGLEGRLALWHKWNETRRFEIASGFHVSTTHVAGSSVPSRLFSVDWHLQPLSKIDFSGSFFQGRNFASLGALPQSFNVPEWGGVVPIHGIGGWAQVSFSLTNRLTLNLFGGEQQNRGRDLALNDIQRNLSYASNLMYHIGPNVIIGLEALQLRTRFVPSNDSLHNHYDLSVAYLF